MIYGANGYTGRLIAAEAASRGLKPVLAGRSPEITAMAKRLGGLESRLFSLDQPVSERVRNLEGVSAVLHCAGPFSSTSRAMLDTCVASRSNASGPTHYLDITGEIDVFESVHARTVELRQAGVVALPGAGFDVVPTDSVAALLKRDLPDATRLALAFRSEGKPSPGTAKSMVEGIAQGGRVRRDGKIVKVPVAWKQREIPFSRGTSNAILSPWGDVSTAYYSTGIPDIEFYIASHGRSALAMKFAGLLMRQSRLRDWAERRIARTVSGPSEQELEKGRCWIWGEAVNPAGRKASIRMETPEPYRLTVVTALESVRRILAGEVAPGAWTPSTAFGAEFALGFDGVRLVP
jgi:short subunit dehydrogenase-like uncharacterized protein